VAQLLENGTLLGGKYRITAPLGQGGMGAVYDAVHEDLHRRVALKVLHPHIAQEETLLERFRREAIAAAELGHPNIIAVSDLQIDAGGHSFMVMERLEGRSLYQVIAEGPLSSDRAAFIATQLLSALDAAHAAGIVHRDLKPENVFLTSIAGVDDVVKLLDFGIAKLVGDGDEGRLTGTGMVLGTPIFMAPEQALGEEVTAATDIYALGGIMFAALTGSPPRRGKTFGAIFHSILTEPVPALRSLRPDLDPELAAIVDRALSRAPADRFESAKIMAAALEPFTPRGQTTPGFRPAAAPAAPLWSGDTLGLDSSARGTDPFAETAATPGELKPPAQRSPDAAPSTPPDAAPSTPPDAAPSTPPDAAPSAAAQRPAGRGIWLALGALGAVLVVFAVLGVLSLTRGDGAADGEAPPLEHAPLEVASTAREDPSGAPDRGPVEALEVAVAVGDAAAADDAAPEDAAPVDAPERELAGEPQPRPRPSKAPRRPPEKQASPVAAPSAPEKTVTPEKAAPSPPEKAATPAPPLEVYLASVNCRSGFAPRPLGPVRTSLQPALGGVRRCFASSPPADRASGNRCFNLSVRADGRLSSLNATSPAASPALDRCIVAALQRVSFPPTILDEATATLQICYRPRGM
jgi:eukaryotic-like serine/threonine-protein kinase